MAIKYSPEDFLAFGRNSTKQLLANDFSNEWVAEAEKEYAAAFSRDCEAIIVSEKQNIPKHLVEEKKLIVQASVPTGFTGDPLGYGPFSSQSLNKKEVDIKLIDAIRKYKAALDELCSLYAKSNDQDNLWQANEFAEALILRVEEIKRLVKTHDK
jgi:hypothetical protein